MSVPISVIPEVIMLLKEMYDRFKANGQSEMTEEQWLEVEAAVADRRTKAWDRFRSARNPLAGAGATASDVSEGADEPEGLDEPDKPEEHSSDRFS